MARAPSNTMTFNLTRGKLVTKAISNMDKNGDLELREIHRVFIEESS
jgi:hypothetical protein